MRCAQKIWCKLRLSFQVIAILVAVASPSFTGEPADAGESAFVGDLVDTNENYYQPVPLKVGQPVNPNRVLQASYNYGSPCSNACTTSTHFSGGSQTCFGGSNGSSSNKCFLFDDSLDTWLELEFLHIWSKGQDVPRLVGSGNGLPPNQSLFGGGTLNQDYFAGIRLITGFWLDQQKTSAIVTSGFVSAGSEELFEFESDGGDSFGIPFIDDSSGATNGLPSSFLLSAPGLLQPGTSASVRAQTHLEMTGGGAYFRKMLRSDCGFRMDWLAGAQLSEIDDEVALLTTTSRAATGDTFQTFDKFQSKNTFLGGQFGLLAELDRGPIGIQMTGKLGVGNMNQQISIQGSNAVNGIETGGGLFTQDRSSVGGPAFNIGDYEQDTFAVVPEVTVKGIWNIRERVDFVFGYSFMYWSDIALAADQVDARLNQDVFFDGGYVAGGGGNPSFDFVTSDFYIHTVDVGLFLNY